MKFNLFIFVSIFLSIYISIYLSIYRWINPLTHISLSPALPYKPIFKSLSPWSLISEPLNIWISVTKFNLYSMYRRNPKNLKTSIFCFIPLNECLNCAYKLQNWFLRVGLVQVKSKVAFYNVHCTINQIIHNIDGVFFCENWTTFFLRYFRCLMTYCFAPNHLVPNLHSA